MLRKKLDDNLIISVAEIDPQKYKEIKKSFNETL